MERGGTNALRFTLVVMAMALGLRILPNAYIADIRIYKGVAKYTSNSNIF